VHFCQAADLQSNLDILIKPFEAASRAIAAAARPSVRTIFAKRTESSHFSKRRAIDA
jgi:hypothetical protein